MSVYLFYYFYAVLLIIAMGGIFPLRKKGIYNYILVALFLPLLIVTENLVGGAYLGVLVVGAELVCLNLLLFKSKWYKLVFMVVFLLALDMIIAVFMRTCFSIPDSNRAEKLEFLRFLFFYFFYALLDGVMLYIVVLIIKRFDREYSGLLKTPEAVILIFFPVSQLLLLGYIYQDITNSLTIKLSLIIIAGTLFSLTADTLLIYLMQRTAHNAELNVRNELLAEQVNAVTKHYKALTEQYENIRHIRHDIDNHMYTVRLLLDRGKLAEAKEYAAELTRFEGATCACLASCGHPIIASFLYGRNDNAERSGLQLDMDVKLPVEIGIDNVDLIAAFGNILDNAEEAALKAEKQTVHLRAYIKNGYLHIETVNPLPAVNEKARRIPELERGIGTQILKNLAEKYDGEFSAANQDGMFHAALILKEKSVE